MTRSFVARGVAVLALVAGPAAPIAAQQQWNDARTRGLVERATALRARQLADTALTDYTATAHGYLTFLGQLGQGFTEPPKVVRADELALEVYWHAPNLSKQRIVGRRDTLALPTDIEYHRDHLGIVQNNFPSIIRLGEGDEVRDVPHPLSPAGLADYDFAISDSLRIRLPDRTLDVYEVKVRPKDPEQPRLVGALYIDRDAAEVVRMAFSFTRPAYLDRELEDISIVLENELVSGRFWLPYRQEIEIRRTGTWLDFPARGIIRGRWEICCYRVNTGVTLSFFSGPEIVTAPPRELARYPWTGRILDSLPPDVRLARDEDVRRVQEEARRLVRAQALARTSGVAVSARRLSDFARVNRVEGLALGAGGVLRVGAGLAIAARGRYGIADHAAKGRLSVERRRASGLALELYAQRDFRDARDVQERSLTVNSLASQEYGSDATDPYDVVGGGLALSTPSWAGFRWRIDASWERQSPLFVHADPFTGRFAATIPAWRVNEARLALLFEHPTSLAPLGSELTVTGEVRAARFRTRDTTMAGQPWYARAFVDAHLERPLGRTRLVSATILGGVHGAPGAPPQDQLYLGGPVTAPGYSLHRFTSTFAFGERLEWRAPVPFVSLPLGRFGHTPASLTLAPYASAVYVRDAAALAAPARGWYPSVGLGALVFFDLLRLDLARGLRDGEWVFSVDLTRDLWRIL